ncbi:hypothetical protein ACMU_04580 [Actibacterium mucosum KCTC 23349]|uniref:GSCFA domain-containing protein n=1 Tax=Actibacterium mucosum KCTC 23349 TaxID=1454373 RepID=A0A037ZGS2_9RHOB|nr:GSCFA domain-containing protein [Actibacterium mucosum]KAJ53985.1 hypothetical protein ACMU_04580 [Actibacterium mucosum KCTC 23349]
MSHPYSDLPPKAFWRAGVAEQNALHIRELWAPKYAIKPRHKIVTAGSCFAQHIGRALSARGYHWFDAEPASDHLDDDARKRFNYGVFSFRTGNIYTARMLVQWLRLALEDTDDAPELWEQDGRFFDPLRPAIEPGGFVSADEALKSRAATLSAIRRAVTEGNVFVFTMGLTESWRNRETGQEYALCPGTLAGTFDADKHEFVNQDFPSIRRDMAQALRMMRTVNSSLRVLLTVSPVPLTATASGQHVLTATTYSKSVLRAVAGQLQADYRFVDYFPSYEIITSPPFRGMFYAPNARNVVQAGVNHVMENFFHDQGVSKPAPTPAPKVVMKEEPTADDVKCEEEMLGAFAK